MSDQGSCRVSEDQREQAISALREHLVGGSLTLEEFSQRAEIALRAVVQRDLDGCGSDLPSADRQSRPGRRRTRFTGALLAHVVRRGRLRLGPRSVAVSVLSDLDLDLREASMETPRTSVIVFALAGNVDVYVPEGVEVDVGGVTVIGHRRDWGSEVGVPHAPAVRVTVLALLGTVDVWRVPSDVVGDYERVIDEVRGLRQPTTLAQSMDSTTSPGLLADQHPDG